MNWIDVSADKRELPLHVVIVIKLHFICAGGNASMPCINAKEGTDILITGLSFSVFYIVLKEHYV